jgi:hypothetical protein
MISKSVKNGIDILTIESADLSVAIAPALGGKILSIYNKKLNKEFLWTNDAVDLAIQPYGADYDSNFKGGVDELIPNDIPETVDDQSYPDHGELWTTVLNYTAADDKINVYGLLKQSSLYYSKFISLDPLEATINLDYTINNVSDADRHFLWKLHAALKIQQGDRLVTPATHGQVVDPAYSRFASQEPFNWPIIENTDASLVPVKKTETDFFYLFGGEPGRMDFVSTNDQDLFSYRYDPKVFPYQWYFASYGGFLDHYTAILEPSTNMPMSVNEARGMGQCCILKAGQTLTTSVKIYAGENK